jgi:RND family efflux transporter MFP subunit
LDNEEGFPHQGQVDFFDNQVNRQTGTIRMRGVFANAERKLVPGLFAKVRILAGKPAEAMLIPDVAVLSDQDRKFVFVLNSSNIAEPRPVQLGRAHGALRTVARGLGPRDQVVVNGLLMVRPGVKVEVLQNPPGATGRP